jgi:hypothetical protein
MDWMRWKTIQEVFLLGLYFTSLLYIDPGMILFGEERYHGELRGWGILFRTAIILFLLYEAQPSSSSLGLWLAPNYLVVSFSVVEYAYAGKLVEILFLLLVIAVTHWQDVQKLWKSETANELTEPSPTYFQPRSSRSKDSKRSSGRPGRSPSPGKALSHHHQEDDTSPAIDASPTYIQQANPSFSTSNEKTLSQRKTSAASTSANSLPTEIAKLKLEVEKKREERIRSKESDLRNKKT